MGHMLTLCYVLDSRSSGWVCMLARVVALCSLARHYFVQGGEGGTGMKMVVKPGLVSFRGLIQIFQSALSSLSGFHMRVPPRSLSFFPGVYEMGSGELLHCTSDRAVRGQGPARALRCSQGTVIVHLFMQVYKRKLANLLLGITLRCWTSIPSKGQAGGGV